jgi:hypothetical protein
MGMNANGPRVFDSIRTKEMQMKVFNRWVLCLSAVIGIAAPLHATAQPWPSKPLQIIVPQGAGGSTDALARVVAQALGERLGQSVVIDNRAGAGGILGVATAAKAPADGYTLLFGSNTTVAANAFLYSSFPVKPLEDLAPLAMVADAPFAFVVPAGSPLKNMRDLLAAAKASPGKLNYGSGTSSALLCAELLKRAAAVDRRAARRHLRAAFDEPAEHPRRTAAVTGTDRLAAFRSRTRHRNCRGGRYQGRRIQRLDSRIRTGGRSA